jgi:N-acetyl-gamma-glutamyl-phosphate reductase common form
MARAAVIGGAGYIGGELIRILLRHPDVRLAAVAGRRSAGRRVDDVHPNLRGASDLRIVPPEDLPECDAYLIAVPRGEAAEIAARLPAAAAVVECSGDFRGEWTLGIPEIARDEIRRSRRVAAAGCFATAAILSLWPLRDLVRGTAIVDGKTGSSGSGATPTEKTHHPTRVGTILAYGAFEHRHGPEIERATGVRVLFQPHSVPAVRGVFTTTYAQVAGDAGERLRAAYARERFVRLVDGSPNVHWVAGSNFVDIGWAQREDRAIVWAALDNLLKGGASQAVQCLNLMLGLPEERGLEFLPGDP